MRFSAYRATIRSIVLVLIICAPFAALAASVDDLQEQLQSAKAALKETQDKIEAFKQRVQEKRRAAQTLQDQIEILNDSIEEITLSIQNTVAQVRTTNSEVENVQEEINQKERELASSKVLLGQYIRQMEELDAQSHVTVFLKYDTFSDAIKESATIQELQDRAHGTIVSIKQIRDDLLSKKQQLEDFKNTLERLKVRQQQQQATLATQNASKKQVLNATKAQEAQFQSQLEQAKQDAKQAEASISNLDSKIREQLRAQGIGNLPTVGLFDWPVDPIFGISCPFHCSGYPYEYLIGPHTGTDIPTPVGTPLRAPADGYVARNHDSGGPGYSYIMLVHGDGLSTVYGHVSGFAAQEGKLVKRGTVIGYSGGALGMRGSGLSSGPHLHFEVRKNNVAVDGRAYLKPR